MKRIAVLLMSIGLMLLLLSAISAAQEKPATEEKAAPEESKAAPEKIAHKYVGVTKCKVCHSMASSGNQYKIWSESKHAKAYETLATPAADSIGKTRDVEKPQESAKCLVCHVTGYEAPASAKAATFKQDEGVGCEVCHGPGSDYMPMKVMKDKEAAIAAGLQIPTEETCVNCHNEKSPTYKKFVFAEFEKQIAHPVPKKDEPAKTK
jgi:hypothetical protein